MKIEPASHLARRRAYREGRRAPPGALNPYFGQPLQEHWSRGHRDRWLFGMGATDKRARRSMRPLVAKLIVAAGTSAIIYSFINALSAQP